MSTGSESQSGSHSSPSEEMKAKFREALDKKQAHGGRDVSDTGEHSKVAGAHGPEARTSQQMFRRKSG